MTKVDVETVQSNLGLLAGLFAESGTVAIYTDLAARLSKIARKEKPWSWRYVQSVHVGTMEPSKKFARAVEILAASMDGLPAFVAETEAVTVYARPGSVHPNAIVIGESKQCENPTCTVRFIPRVPWQKYCPIHRKRKTQVNE